MLPFDTLLPDALLKDATARGDVPGATAILLDRHGPVWSGTAGQRDTATAAPLAPDTVFSIASMTKPLTTIAALQLVDQGTLSLDAPVTDILPNLAPFQILESMDGDDPVLRPARTPPTLRQLLTHTSGYAYPRWDATLTRAICRLGLDPLPRDEPGLRRTPLVFDPGTRWTYGIGIDVVGKMIEAATGTPLDTVVEENICRPLGMYDTTFVLTDAQRARAAPIHVRENGNWVPSGPVPGRKLAFLSGGGGMFGTAPDYAKLLAELLAGAPRLLAPATWAEATRNQIGDLQVTMLRSADQMQSVDLDLCAGQAAKWGLGFMINPAPLPGRRHAGSLAWSGLANTYFWLDPSAGLAGVLMTATLPFGHPGPLNLFEAFERAAYAARPASPTASRSL